MILKAAWLILPLFSVIPTAMGGEQIDLRHELLVVARAEDPDEPEEILGNQDLFTRKASPASTAKIALALVALEDRVIDLDSTYVCSDRTAQPAPMNLARAMESSSNEFFEHLLRDVGVDRIEKHLGDWDYSVPMKSLRLEKLSQIVRGKAFFLSPRDQLRFIGRVARHDLKGISKRTHLQLDAALALKENPAIRGKTGSDREGSWFVAYGGPPEDARVFVVRSDLPNSDGKRLKRILLEHLARRGNQDPQN